MTNLTLEQAHSIANNALKTGRDMNLKPLTVAVLDAGGHMVAFLREDGSGIIRPEMARAKAYGCLGLGMGSRGFSEREIQFLAPLATASRGRVLPVLGGVLIRDGKDGPILGAVGISGDTSTNDETAVVAGIESAGLYADTGAS